MFEQAVLPVQDAAHFAEGKAVLEHAFAVNNVAEYLRRLNGANIRVRDFEGALGRGLLGPVLPKAYAALGDSDRGQLRELYLSLVEHVAPELRARFLKLYAYY
jgi:hypothetical protein